MVLMWQRSHNLYNLNTPVSVPGISKTDYVNSSQGDSAMSKNINSYSVTIVLKEDKDLSNDSYSLVLNAGTEIKLSASVKNSKGLRTYTLITGDLYLELNLGDIRYISEEFALELNSLK